jgi:hypothetical protein
LFQLKGKSKYEFFALKIKFPRTKTQKYCEFALSDFTQNTRNIFVREISSPTITKKNQVGLITEFCDEEPTHNP